MKKLMFAALLASVVAVPAQAANWVQYTFSGTGSGNYYDLNRGIDEIRAANFAGSLILDLDANPTGFSSSYPGLQTQSASVLGDSYSLSAYQMYTSTTRAGISGGARLNFAAGTSNGVFSPSVATFTGGTFNFFEIIEGYSGFQGVSGTVQSLSVSPIANSERPSLNFSVSSAVPEPATWAMLLVGFGAIGGTLRRKPKVAVSYAV